MTLGPQKHIASMLKLDLQRYYIVILKTKPANGNGNQNCTLDLQRHPKLILKVLLQR